MKYNQDPYRRSDVIKNAKKSRFNRSRQWKAQMQPGFLIPCLLEEVFPGDEYEIDPEFLYKFQSLWFPILHKLTMRCDVYEIPNRIIWPDRSTDLINQGWSKWITMQNEEELPKINVDCTYDNSFIQNRVGIYMGLPAIPMHAGNTELISDLVAFPFSAYLKIWDEYYRIPQLEDERWFPLQPGDNTAAFEAAFDPIAITGAYDCLPSKWEKDYVTSCLPTPQFNDAINLNDLNDFDKEPNLIRKVTDDAPLGINSLKTDATGNLEGDVDGSAYIDLVTTTTTKQIRLAEIYQEFRETILQIGQRYRDYIKGLWKDDPQPGVVDVPILIGSRFGRVNISETYTTANTEGDGQGYGRGYTGEYSGNASMYARDGGIMRHKVREHGFIMGIVQVNADTSYGQGIERFWRRSVQTDYPLDMFQHIGDQEVMKEEVVYNYRNGEVAKNFETFGYIPRFAESMYANNVHIGRMNFDEGKSMHLGRIFNVDVDYSTNIVINDRFTNVNSNDPYDLEGGGFRLVDTFKVLPLTQSEGSPSQPAMFAHIFWSIYVNRQLAMFSTPKL